MGSGMEALEAQTDSFVGRLWLEEIDGWIVWHGPSQRCRKWRAALFEGLA
jgi:hypothetical protein